MAKQNLNLGIGNLLSGASTEVTQEAAPKAAPIKEEATAQEENELINSIEDEELRAELQERLRQKRMIGRGRPRTAHDERGKRTDGYNRTSLIVNVEKWEKIKEIAFRETLTMKEITELALDMVIERYESKNGTIIVTEKEKRDINDIF